MAVVGLYLWAVLPYELNPYDEGVIAYGAEQVLKGRRPGVDFYVPYSPGAFYAVAAAFKLFGTRLLVERCVGAAAILAVVALGFALLVLGWRAGRVVTTPVLLASAAAGMAGLMLGVGWFSPVTGGALALFLLSGLAVIAAAPRGGVRRAFVVGLTIGLLMLWRLDFGLGALAAAGVTWMACAGRGVERGGPPARTARSLFAGILALGAGAAVVALPPFWALLSAGGARAANSLLWWPLLGTKAAELPWPPLLPGPMPPAPAEPALLERLAHATGGWPFYFPALAVALAAPRFLGWRTLTPPDRAAGVWLLASAVPLFVYASGRTDYAHVLPLLVVSFLLAAWGAGTPEGRPRLQAIAFVAGLLLLIWQPLAHLSRVPPAELLPMMALPGPRGAGVYPNLPFGMQYQRIVRALHEVVPPEGRIFSGTPRHDLFLTNDIMLYFLAERDAGTYYWCLDAGVTTSEPVQREMVAELQASQTRAAVLWLIAQNPEANLGAQSSGVTLLDDFLKERFRSVPYQPADSKARFYELLVPRAK